MRCKLRTLVGAALVTGAAVAALSIPAVATAGERVKPGAECATVGVVGWHHGEKYRCEQRPGDDCPRWRWVYNPHTPKGSWSPRPKTPCDCPSASPSSAPSPATTPSASASVGAVGTPTATSTGVDSTPVGQELPVTGGTPYWTAGLGLVLVLLGAGAIAAGGRRHTNP